MKIEATKGPIKVELELTQEEVADIRQVVITKSEAVPGSYLLRSLAGCSDVSATHTVNKLFLLLKEAIR